MKPFALHNLLKAKPGQGDKLANILLEASKLIANANGCSLYMVSQDQQDTDAIWVTEVWQSEKDHELSLKIAGVSELIMKALPLLDGPPQKGNSLHVVGGFGIPGA